MGEGGSVTDGAYRNDLRAAELRRVCHRFTINPWARKRIWTIGAILMPVLGLDPAHQFGVLNGPRVGRCFCSGADPELAQYAVDVVLHCVQRNEQLVGD